MDVFSQKVRQIHQVLPWPVGQRIYTNVGIAGVRSSLDQKGTSLSQTTDLVNRYYTDLYWEFFF